MTNTIESIALRDAAGVWYVLTSEMLHAAQASPEQQAELDAEFDGDTSGFGAIVHELGNYRQLGNYGQLGNYRSFSPLGGMREVVAEAPITEVRSIVG